MAVVLAFAVQQQLHTRKQQLHEEHLEKQSLKKLLMIWCDKQYVWADSSSLVVDNGLKRIQLIKHYLQRCDLLNGMSHDTCVNWDLQ